MPLNFDLNVPLDHSDVVDSMTPMMEAPQNFDSIHMENRAPFIDLNLPWDDSNADDSITPVVEASQDSNSIDKENREPFIDLNLPSSTITDQFADDLNAYTSYEEEDVAENESESSLSDADFNDNIDDHFVDELEPNVDTGIQHDPDEGGDEQDETQPAKKKRTFLGNEDRKNISMLLLKSSKQGKLLPGTIRWLASSYSVSSDVIYRIWRQMKQTGDACHRKTKTCGRKRVEIDIETVRRVSLAKRSTLRALASAVNTTKTKLSRYLKEGVLRRHSNVLKPYLKEENKIARVRFCLSMLEESSIPHDPRFKSMHNIVHIDEKWFYMSKKTKNYYLLADEDEPHRTCRNKKFIGKVMFLVAVARPRFDHDDTETFSGKIGVFPLVDKVPARRSSVNRAAGTLETKPISSITKEVSRKFLIEKVLPAIKEKWPREHARETIYIQQDNAPCHVPVDDEEFCRVASEDGFDIRLTCQPPNSPDLNVLDLGFFNAIQSLQQQEVTNSVDELIEAVQTSYDAFSSKDSNKIFVTLQTCMIEIMKAKGCNGYHIPHIKKDAMLNHGGIPTQLSCDKELVHEVSTYLQTFD